MAPNDQAGAVDVIRVLGPRAEEWGYSSLWATDHVVGVRAMDGVYGSYWLEALTTLTWLAAATSQIRLGTGVLVVPMRNPVLTAKMISTLDQLSGGRVCLGVGTGWSRTEYRALGVESLFASRGAVTNEALDVMAACWAGGEIAAEGPYFPFSHIGFAPTPSQLPGPPVWVGGHSPAALRRAANYADVWHPHDLEPAELAGLGQRLDDLAGRPVRRSVRIAVQAHLLDSIQDRVAAYAAAGCEEVVLDFRSQPCDTVLRGAARAAEVLLA